MVFERIKSLLIFPKFTQQVIRITIVFWIELNSFCGGYIVLYRHLPRGTEENH